MLALGLLTLGLAAVATAGAVPELIKTRNEKGEKIHLPLKDATVIGPVVPGGPNVTFTGQHYEIEAQMAKYDLGWAMNHTEHQHLSNETHALEARSNRVSYYCFNGFAYADWGAMNTNINYMSKWPSNYYCQAAPRTCTRFACYDNAAVLMCNDTPNPVTILCSTLTQNTNFILGACSNIFWGRTQGQAFYINPSYNVLVKHTDKGKECGKQQH